MRNKNGFTLIELMIVIAIIGILLGSTFKLVGIAQGAKARAVTTSRLERLQYALSGYYAAYGMYPAVPIYQNPSLNDISEDSDTGEALNTSSGKATACARAQPIAFEYPTPQNLDENVGGFTKLQSLVNDENGISINTLVDSLDSEGTSWDKYKGFKFGLMSFLLPRVEVVGMPDTAKGPVLPIFAKGQWRANNPMSETKNLDEVNGKLILQRGLEEGACKRWLPYLEDTLSSFKKEIYGVKVGSGGGANLVKRGKGPSATESGSQIYLAQSTVKDGWGKEFFYYSAPPHQSFRIWSSGPDGKTFPPWEKLTTTAEAWVKDDIVGGKM
jgi:prepilin-type N-terminal cleavage/methylation domain-containing protein